MVNNKLQYEVAPQERPHLRRWHLSNESEGGNHVLWKNTSEREHQVPRSETGVAWHV